MGKKWCAFFDFGPEICFVGFLLSDGGRTEWVHTEWLGKWNSKLTDRERKW